MGTPGGGKDYFLSTFHPVTEDSAGRAYNAYDQARASHLGDNAEKTSGNILCEKYLNKEQIFIDRRGNWGGALLILPAMEESTRSRGKQN